MKYRTIIKYTNKAILTIDHDSFEKAETHLLNETGKTYTIIGQINDMDGEQIAEYIGNNTTQEQYESENINKAI